MKGNLFFFVNTYKNKLRLCHQPAFSILMRQPPAGDRKKYEDQQRSNEGRAAVTTVGWLLWERELVFG
jgi:hypothetical protein